MVMAYNLSKDNSLFSNLPLCINKDANWESCDVIEKKNFQVCECKVYSSIKKYLRHVFTRKWFRRKWKGGIHKID